MKERRSGKQVNKDPEQNQYRRERGDMSTPAPGCLEIAMHDSSNTPFKLRQASHCSSIELSSTPQARIPGISDGDTFLLKTHHSPERPSGLRTRLPRDSSGSHAAVLPFALPGIWN